MSIKEGDIVWVKSGGPAMTAAFEDPKGLWRCSWFVGTEPKHDSFQETVLTTEDPNQSGQQVFRGTLK